MASAYVTARCLPPGPWPPFFEGLTLDGISVHLDSADVHVTARAMAAARHQVGKTDLVDLLLKGVEPSRMRGRSLSDKIGRTADLVIGNESV
jgi:hypothetical protein